METDRHAARPAGHLTLATRHHLQSNLNVTFALLSSLPPLEPQENPGILTAKHQLHYPTPAKIDAVLRVIPSGTPLTPDPKKDKRAPLPHPQLCAQFSQQSNSSFSALTKILVAFSFAFPSSHRRWQMSVSVEK